MKYFELIISNNISELGKLRSAIDKLSAAWELDPRTSMHINLVLEELITNIIFYGYKDDAEHKIMLEFTKAESELLIEVTDDATEFNIMEAEDFNDTGKPAEERKIGGLGIHFVKSMMDELTYRREDGSNVLTLKKKI